MKLVLLFSLLLTHFCLFGQISESISDLNKKSQKKYTKVSELIKKKKFDKAMVELKELIVNHPNFVEGQSKLVSLYLRQNQDSLAIIHLRYLVDNNLSHEPKVVMTLVDKLEEKDNYLEALKYISLITESTSLSPKNKKFVTRRFEELKFRENTYSHPVEFIPELIDDAINTPKSESLPAFSADGSIMIYTSIDQSAGRNKHEDLFISYVDEAGSFSNGKSIEALNTFENEGAHTLSQDGSTIIFTACNRRDSYGGCDLYISFNKDGKWSEAYNMGPKINSRFAEKQPTLSSNGKTLYFSSTRKGGHGKEDIWKVNFENGNWSEPINLGLPINTNGNEGSPFLHPDNQTLYFRSDGHIGLGDYDLFISRKSDTLWNAPKNLGHPINSKTNDGALFVDLFGNYAYYTSDKFSSGDHLDILKFKLPEELKPQAVSYLNIVVYNNETQEAINAKVNITDLNLNENLHSFTTPKDGSTIVINKGHYAVNIDLEGFVFHSENININESTTIIDPIKYVVYLSPIIKEKIQLKPTILKNIFFESGSADLLEISNNELNSLFNLLKDQSEIKIKIFGHTDNVGDESDNLKLSEERAKAVLSHLVMKGIDQSRLSYIGKGETEPIMSNDTEEGRQINRRTTFLIVSN